VKSYPHCLLLPGLARSPSRTWTIISAVLLLSLYVSSVFMPAIDFHFDYIIWGRTSRASICLMGYGCLGWLPFGLMFPWWWPNPLFLLGLVLLILKRREAAYECSKLAFGFAISFVVLVPIFLSAGLRFPLHSGYFVWLGCITGLTWFARQPASMMATSACWEQR
jgi:hypothetical protein